MTNSTHLEKRIKYNFLQHNTITDGLLYKYCSIDTLLLIIENSNLYYSTSDEFNDPFELTTQIFEGFDNNYLAKYFIGDLDELTIENFSLFNTDYTKIIKNAWKSLIPQIGISCFSKSPLISLMWSHYSNKHKGVCLGFNFDIEENTEKVIQMPVRYLDNIEQCDFFNEENISTGLMAYHWLLSKSKIWEYENEVRRIYISKKGLLPINLNALSEIYLGLNTNNKDLDTVSEVLEKFNLNNVSIIRTKILPLSYQIGI